MSKYCGKLSFVSMLSIETWHRCDICCLCVCIEEHCSDYVKLKIKICSLLLTHSLSSFCHWLLSRQFRIQFMILEEHMEQFSRPNFWFDSLALKIDLNSCNYVFDCVILILDNNFLMESNLIVKLSFDCLGVCFRVALRIIEILLRYQQQQTA